MLELLAPAKNLACGIAAIDHGADAVYIGAERFGARAAAGNSIADIAELCSYAHQFGAKVYVTTNTIIYDHELADTLQLMHSLKRVGVDAFLVQDMGIVQELRNQQPQPFVLHASTQTDNRTVEKVAWLRSIGFRRVVLARELSLEEMSEIHRRVPDVELEVFVHGALCVSYSGQCYASQYCMGRSANRGECAQMCRMKYDLVDADGRELQHQRYLLSLKDLCQIDHLEELADAGAVSFKIEGRLKDVDYVKNVVAAYSEQLNELVARRPNEYGRASVGEVDYAFTPNLKKTFNRGYTNYFLQCHRNEHGVLEGRRADIFSPDTPKAMGEYVGKVKAVHPATRFHRSCFIEIDSNHAFSNGDGLCFLLKTNDGSRELVGVRVNRVEGNRLHLLKIPEGLHTGMALYRNNDVAFSKLMAGKTAVRKIPVTMRFDVVADDGRGGSSLRLQLNACGEHVVVHEKADAYPGGGVSHETQRVLGKLGNTPYKCAGFDEGSDFSWSVPASSVASLRRFGVEVLSRKLQEKFLQPAADSASAVPPVPSAYPCQVPPAGQPHLLNVANSQAKAFYAEAGVEAGQALEVVNSKSKQHDVQLMHCRHCIKYSLGYCEKHGGRKPRWREPLSLRLADGRKFRLAFNCLACEMKVFMNLTLVLMFTAWALLTSCYGEGQQRSEVLVSETPDSTIVADSVSFGTYHHYAVNYNFVVKADSLMLLRQQPEEQMLELLTDSFAVKRHAQLVVADVRTLPLDTIDSVWVQLATVDSQFGWIHESELLPAVVPDDPISQFISFFSDTHLLLSLIVVILIGTGYLFRVLTRRNAHIVLFNDIDSFFPALLTLIIAAAATFYASMQMFAPEVWRHFYYNPTLNPFSVPPSLGIFLISVWAMLIIGLAAADDVRHQLPAAEALMYLAGLGAVCAVEYIVFSITTLYYVGYVLLAAYTWVIVKIYLHRHAGRFVCGKCGHKLRRKGRCPHCGAMNV